MTAFATTSRAGQIVQKISAKKSFGYSFFRTSLYGPPGRIGRDFDGAGGATN